MTEAIYPKGLKIWQPHENAPKFVKGRLSIHLDTFAEWAAAHVDEKGYVSLQLKEGREGLYASLDTWRKKKSDDAEHRDHRDEAPSDNGNLPDVNPDDIPF